ncbi:MAG: MarR family transcriptional regulator [Candidatus Marinimicrobia bacterium]|jgi:DNA-binding IscR family transcriptional regulator|nr:MarR family transcriptional regulator [Candidatus Neomarinimicrobiota bacterium]MDD5061895.1 FaeA/PapI family transcriptional regulator [Candidatus Neomarinimicrobiota bacterium]MDD5231102.1 FaeA/PapI family transcriptional regulator [Candidatus Neomarinimicrobiota bacterium]MDD5541360.1 FaeA/PapI family transcriptional regulator [Candidatus Neomarinimicrobiota bacterium]
MSDMEMTILSTMQKAGKPVKAGEIAEMSGIPKDQVVKIITKLKKQGKIASPKACFYVAVN